MKFFLFTSLIFCVLATAGCITAHEATVELQMVDFHEGKKLDDCFLLTIESRSLEKVGSWWIVGQEATAPMTPRRAAVRKINSGENIHQAGEVVVLAGPYVKDHAIGYDYWIFRRDYQPESFQDIRLERDYAAGKPVKISIEREVPGDKYSDDKVLDGARKLLAVKELFSPTNPAVCDLFQQMRLQVINVKASSFRLRDIRAAEQLARQLEKCIERFTAAEVGAEFFENHATNPEK